jgi:hypothetical protein
MDKPETEQQDDAAPGRSSRAEPHRERTRTGGPPGRGRGAGSADSRDRDHVRDDPDEPHDESRLG